MTEDAPAARESANALQAGAAADSEAGKVVGSSPAPSSTPPPAPREAAAGKSVPTGVALIERLSREIDSRYRNLSMLREAAAQVGEEIVQLELERAVAHEALEALRVRNYATAPFAGAFSSLKRMDVEEAEAAMAARRVS